ncbi:MAG TPA: phosphate acetyltransferase [Lentisphaeria bacterium]|nr:MAG: phosphate acetyltransferase [Lentisphaerae bacterium GWF2_49_21]HBC86577.1 phosphate acetyltransferase [Lentisphaeria bacterium]
MSFLQQIINQARRTPGRRIIFPEGNDPRIVLAAEKIAEEKIAIPILLGTESEINDASKDGIPDKKFHSFDHLKSEMLDRFAAEFCEIRKRKSMTHDKALEIVRNRLFYGAMMVRRGLADGMVAGSIATTSETLRAALTVIGMKEGKKTLSGAFFMDLNTPTQAGDKVLLFADCAVNPNPDPEQLAEIAVSSAEHFKHIVGTKPRIAFLSFSTHGSAGDDSTLKITQAVDIAKEKLKSSGIEAEVDGELQADSSLVPEVAKRKCRGDAVLNGNANVLIFPDLNSGNIGYKLVERLAGASAYGPILQGLAKPVNDLSRGCSVDDIVGVAAITVCQG